MNATHTTARKNDAIKDVTLVQLVELDDIYLDASLQPRAHSDRRTVASYAQDLQNGDKFPPLVLYENGGAKMLSEGWHRFQAAKLAGQTEFPCEIRKGSYADALLNSAGSNIAHGLRRTNEDKRRAVTMLLSDPKWTKRSDRWIATTCGVGNRFVGDIRREVCPEHACEPREGADGKIYQAPPVKEPAIASEFSEGIDAGSDELEPDSETDDEPEQCPRGGAHDLDETGTCLKCFEPDLPQLTAAANPVESSPDADAAGDSTDIKAVIARMKADIKLLRSLLVPFYGIDDAELKSLLSKSRQKLAHGSRGVNLATEAVKRANKLAARGGCR